MPEVITTATGSPHTHGHPGAATPEREALRAAADFQGARNLGELGRAFVAAAERISPGDLIYIQHFHMRLGKVSALAPNIDWPFNPDEQTACARLFLRHPMIVATAAQPATERIAVSDVLGSTAWRHQSLYNDVFRRNRFDFQQALNFPLDAESNCALVVMRSGSDYTDREKRVMTLIRRMAVPALRRVLRMEQARDELSLLATGADELGLAVIALAPSGRPARFSAEAARLLHAHGNGSGPKALLAAITRWLDGARREATRPHPLVLPTAIGSLRLRPSLGTISGGGYVFLEDLERRTPHPAYKVHGLSEREGEILQGLVQGLSDALIAGRMHVGLRTVQEYTARIFTKLGVSNREAAASWARAAQRTHHPREEIPSSLANLSGLQNPQTGVGITSAFFRYAMPAPDA